MVTLNLSEEALLYLEIALIIGLSLYALDTIGRIVLHYQEKKLDKLRAKNAFYAARKSNTFTSGFEYDTYEDYIKDITE